MATDEKRIGLLDSFRFIAITMVVFCHFYKGNTVLKAMGGMGVDFFFIISGFVIYFTLTKCHGLKEFFVKRFARIYPPLVLACIITYIAVKLLDHDREFARLHNQPTDFLPSLTFIEPYFWDKIFKGVFYIDGSHWSLIPEVRFYVISGAIYFLLKRKELFVRRWTLFVLFVTITHTILSIWNRHELFENMFIFRYIGFFTLGIYFYDYYVNRKLKLEYILPYIIIVKHFFDVWPRPVEPCIMLVLFTILFFLFINNSKLLKPLELAPIRRIGMISYSIYLLHQSIGIILVRKLAGDSPMFMQFLASVAVYVLFILIAEILLRVYELPVKRWLYKLLLKKR